MNLEWSDQAHEYPFTGELTLPLTELVGRAYHLTCTRDGIDAYTVAVQMADGGLLVYKDDHQQWQFYAYDDLHPVEEPCIITRAGYRSLRFTTEACEPTTLGPRVPAHSFKLKIRATYGFDEEGWSLRLEDRGELHQGILEEALDKRFNQIRIETTDYGVIPDGTADDLEWEGGHQSPVEPSSEVDSASLIDRVIRSVKARFPGLFS